MENQNNINMPEDQPKAKRTFEGTKASLPNKKGKKVFKIIASLALAAGLITLASFVYLKYFYNVPSKGVYADINGQKISNKEFNEIYDVYLKFDQTNSRDPNSVDKKQVERKVADEVLLRLSLQSIASQNGVEACSEKIVDERLKEQYQKYGNKQAYFDSLATLYGWTWAVSYNKECTDYYKEKLESKLIKSVDLEGIYIRWDISNGQSDEIKKKVDEYAKSRMENEYLPLFEKGLPFEEIKKRADINDSTTTEEFDTKVVNLDRSPSRIIESPGMNRYIYDTYQQYEEGESEYPYFENLQTGKNTKVFKSKTGYWVVYRAKSRTNGKYESYDALRDEYVKRGKVQKSYFNLPAAKKIETNNGVKGQTSFLEAIKDYLVPKAEAGNVWCFADKDKKTNLPNVHYLPFSIEYKDFDTKLSIPGVGNPPGYPGPVISSTGNILGSCLDPPTQAAYAIYGVGVSYSPGGQVTLKPAAILAPIWNFSLSCYTSWLFTFNAPQGYFPLTPADYNNAQRFYLNLLYSSSGFSGYEASSPTAPAGTYKINTNLYSKIANGARGFNIQVYFSKIPPAQGKIINQKILGTRQADPATPPGNSRFGISSNKLNREVFVSNANPWEQKIDTPTYGDSFGDYIDLPNGYKLNDSLAAKISKPNNVLVANKKVGELGCKPISGGQRCYVFNLSVPAGETIFVDWFIEKIPPTLELSCNSDTPATAGQINIKASTNIPGDPATSDVLADYDKNPPTKPTPSGTYDIDSDYRDGEKHTFYVSFQGIIKSLTIGPNEQCKIQAWYYPWLQTKNGDVVANGKIIGQQSGDKRLGSRPATQKEAEYLIIASFSPYAEGGSNFCSIYNYILTNPNATKGNCTNGFGYTLNNNTLGNGNDDNVTKGVAQAYSDLPESCRADGVPAEINISSSDCPKGKIFKKPAGALGNIRVIKGRATILVDGNLDINGQEPIVYAEVNGGAPQDQPNLAIVVKGDVNINQSVNRTNALIYATGKINTCSGAPTACKNQLYSNGSLVAKNGFSFNRTYYNKSSRGAAEFVILNPVSILYPPPGISSEYFVGYNNGASVDAGEFQPRF